MHEVKKIDTNYRDLAKDTMPIHGKTSCAKVPALIEKLP